MLSFLQKMIYHLLQIRVLQIRVLQIRVLQIRVLQIQSVFYKSNPVRVLQYANFLWKRHKCPLLLQFDVSVILNGFDKTLFHGFRLKETDVMFPTVLLQQQQ